nr:MAG: signal peptidase II [Pseudomonadota bacterium]
MPEAIRSAWLRWLALAAAVAVADQLTKWWIEAVLEPGERITVAPFFDLVLAFNRGAAFSFLADASGWQRVFFIAVAVVASAVILYLLRKHQGERLFSFGLALILGGALGNLWDRLVLGHVVDFLLLHAYGYHWPAFNLADSAITLGAGLLIYDSFRGTRRGERLKTSGR